MNAYYCTACEEHTFHPQPANPEHLRDPDVCDWCEGPAVLDLEYDPTPWCSACGARRPDHCDCGPMTRND